MRYRCDCFFQGLTSFSEHQWHQFRWKTRSRKKRPTQKQPTQPCPSKCRDEQHLGVTNRLLAGCSSCIFLLSSTVNLLIGWTIQRNILYLIRSCHHLSRSSSTFSSKTLGKLGFGRSNGHQRSASSGNASGIGSGNAWGSISRVFSRNVKQQRKTLDLSLYEGAWAFHCSP